jgi:hypothetical protein
MAEPLVSEPGPTSGTPQDLLQRSRHQRSCSRSTRTGRSQLSDSIPTRPPTSPSAQRCSANAYRVRSRAETIITLRTREHESISPSPSRNVPDNASTDRGRAAATRTIPPRRSPPICRAPVRGSAGSRKREIGDDTSSGGGRGSGVLVLALSGCGSDAGRCAGGGSVRRRPRHGDTARACALLAPDTRGLLEYQQAQPCAQALRERSLATGAVQGVEVWGGQAGPDQHRHLVPHPHRAGLAGGRGRLCRPRRGPLHLQGDGS